MIAVSKVFNQINISWYDTFNHVLRASICSTLTTHRHPVCKPGSTTPTFQTRLTPLPHPLNLPIPALPFPFLPSPSIFVYQSPLPLPLHSTPPSILALLSSSLIHSFILITYIVPSENYSE